MEKIKEILSQESLSEADINYLVANKGSLSEADLVRLGLAPAIEAVKEPVKEEESTVSPEPAPEKEVETPRRGRGRRSL